MKPTREAFNVCAGCPCPAACQTDLSCAEDSVHLAKPLAESAVAPGECGSVPDIEWRKLLAITYCGFPALYCDDGELQDNRTHPFIDFKRDSVDEIWDAMRRRTTSALQSGMQPPNTAGQPNEQNAVQTEQPSLSDAEILTIALANGFKLKMTDADKSPDLSPYVYQFARALLAQRQDSDKDPMGWTLPCDVFVGHGTFKKGVKLRTLVARMKVLYEMATGKDADAIANGAPK